MEKTKVCNCNCHGMILHSPKCNKNKQKTRRLALKTKCNCVPHNTGKNGLCTGCYKNHPNNSEYESVKYISKIF